MSRPHPGLYRIEVHRHDEPTLLLYATNNGIDKIVTVAEAEHVTEQQTWRVEPGEKPDTYIILPAPMNQPSRLLWSYKQLGEDEPIALLPETKEFFLEPAGEAGHDNVYFIRPDITVLDGIEVYVDTEEDRDVVLRTFPVAPGHRPQWRFEHAVGPDA
jgi:hypothetical protein